MMTTVAPFTPVRPASVCNKLLLATSAIGDKFY
jgi:hypothetical protein